MTGRINMKQYFTNGQLARTMTIITMTLGIIALFGFVLDSVRAYDSLSAKVDTHIAEVEFKDENANKEIEKLNVEVKAVTDTVGAMRTDQALMKQSIEFIEAGMAEMKNQQEIDTKAILEAIKNGG